VSPDQAKGWLSTFLPVAERAGPALSLILALLLAGSLWYGLGLLRECVERNRTLAAQLVTQQETFHRELLVYLQRCQPQP
jgi:hypothetical protein